MLQWLEGLAAALCIFGAFAVTSRQRSWRYYSFWTGAISSVLLLVVYVVLQAWPLIPISVVYLVADVYGIWNNRKDP